MLGVKRLANVGGTVLCALGIGYVMQNSAETAPRAVPADSVTNWAPVEKGKQVMAFTEAMLTSAAPTAQTASIQLPAVTGNAPILASVTRDSIEKISSGNASARPFCENAMKAEPVFGAMVSLEIAAPCMTNERFTVHHNGMMFTEVTDADGNSKITVPALSEQATFIASFARGGSAVATAYVTSLEQYDRAVVQWSGGKGLHINSVKYQLKRPGDGDFQKSGVEEDDSLKYGFVTHHGVANFDNALLAEVITMPRGSSTKAGDELFRVEGEITTANCGREVEAQSIRIFDDRVLQVQEVALTMPGCSAIGGIRVLKNLFNDQTIARN